MKHTQVGGDFTGMLLILILLMVVAGVGGLVAWKMKLFGLGDDSDDDGGKGKNDDNKQTETKKSQTKITYRSGETFKVKVDGCSPSPQIPTCNYGITVFSDSEKTQTHVKGISCPSPGVYNYDVSERGQSQKVTKSTVMPMKCAMNLYEGSIYTHVPIGIGQKNKPLPKKDKQGKIIETYAEKTYWLRTDTTDGHFFGPDCYSGNTTYMMTNDDNMDYPPNKTAYVMRIIPYDDPNPDIPDDFSFNPISNPVYYNKKYILMFDTPNRVLSPGPTFNEVKFNKKCNPNKKFGILDKVGGYMSLAKKTITDKSSTDHGKIATPIIFLNAANPTSKSTDPVKVNEPVKIGFAPYTWGQYTKDIIPSVEGGEPARTLSSTNYHTLFSKQQGNTAASDISGSTHRYVAIDTGEEYLSTLVSEKDGEDIANDMNYTFFLSNTPCEDVEKDCSGASTSKTMYHPYSAQPQASMCNKTLGFCPKPISS